jgi:hypothetical protein
MAINTVAVIKMNGIHFTQSELAALGSPEQMHVFIVSRDTDPNRYDVFSCLFYDLASEAEHTTLVAALASHKVAYGYAGEIDNYGVWAKIREILE